MFPVYSLNKIKFGIDRPTFEKAVGLYENRKVTQFEIDIHGISAVVIGTKPYNVFVSARHYDRGNCDCYLGQRDVLCKHMVAVAIQAVMDGKSLSEKDKEIFDEPICNGRIGELSKEELSAIKKSITSAMKYIKGYRGPSKIWFAYQNSLSGGCNRLSAIVSELPVSKQTAKLLIDMLLRLDKKLCEGGVDDSDGAVGRFIYQTVDLLQEYLKLDPKCLKVFKKLCNQQTCFCWEEPLVKIFDEQNID